MKHTKINSSETLIPSGTWLAHGCLMSPEDVQTAHSGRAAPELVTWTLCGDVPDVRELLHRGDVTQSGFLELARVARSPVGHRYLLLVHQAACWQHRWILWMDDPAVRACLEAVASGGPLGFALVGKSEETLIWRSQLSPGQARAMLVNSEAGSLTATAASEDDFSRAAMHLCSPTAFASLQPGVDVTDVSVTAIRPERVHREAVHLFSV